MELVISIPEEKIQKKTKITYKFYRYKFYCYTESMIKNSCPLGNSLACLENLQCGQQLSMVNI